MIKVKPCVANNCELTEYDKVVDWTWGRLPFDYLYNFNIKLTIIVLEEDGTLDILTLGEL